MPATEMTMMIAVFAAVTLSLIHLFRLIGTAIVHRTIRRAVEIDSAAAAPLLDRLGDARDQRGDDDRLSVILIAIGIAMVAASVVINEPAWMYYGVAGALFPLIVGTALWLRLFVLERNRRRGAGQ